MGSQMSEPEPNDKGPGTHPTTASAVTSAPCPSGHPSKEHLVLAFFAGVILTLLLMAFVFLIIKSFRKCHSSPQTLDPPSDHPAKLSSSEEVLTYASMIFKAPKENDAHLTESVQNAVYSDPAVYAQVKVTNSPCLSSEAWVQFLLSHLHLHPSFSILTNSGLWPDETTAGAVWMCLDNASPQFEDQGSIFSWPEKRSMALPLGPTAC